MQPSTFNCQECNKHFKSKGGLKTHTTRKHPERASQETVSQKHLTPDMTKLIDKSLQRVLESSYCPDTIKFELELFFSDDANLSSKNSIITELAIRHELKSTEKSYSELYKNIVLQKSAYFPELSSHSATYLCTKVVDEIISRFISTHSTEDTNTEVAVGMDIDIDFSEIQMAGLQYLAGYCIHNLYKKTHACKNRESPELQKTLALLMACKCENEAISNQRLIAAISRGGLWGTVTEIVEILKIAEVEFLRRTHNKKLRNIPFDEIVLFLISHEEVKSYFSLIVEKAEVIIGDETDERTIATLRSILELYLKVRSHSYARNVVNTVKAKQKIRTKGLRKDIKKSVQKDASSCI